MVAISARRSKRNGAEMTASVMQGDLTSARLVKLTQLHAQGALTDEEFAAAQKNLLI